MLENISGFGDHPQLIYDLQGFQLAQQALEFNGEAGNSLKQADEELSANHRRELNRPLAVIPQPVEAGHDYSLDGPRNRQFAQCLGHFVTTVLEGDVTKVEKGLGYLFYKEWYSLRLLHKRGPQFFRE